jgi:hypothetical protein
MPDELEDRPSLKPLAHGRRVHPEQRPGDVAMFRPPSRVSGGETTPPAERPGELGIAGGGDGG